MEFQVNTNNVILAQINQVESGEYNVTECRFIFSSEYEGLTKIAVFTGANGDAYKITILNNKCEIPSELLTESQIVQIGVYAYEVQGKEFILRYSPMSTRFMIEKGSYVVNAVNMSRPTPTEVEQLQSQITHNANDIEDLQQTVSEHTTDISNIQSDINDIKAEQTEQNTNIQKNTDDIVNINQAIDTINTDITDIDSAIGDINEDIDNLEQDLTNYSLITETGSQINLNVNSTNYQITAILKDKNGNVIYTSNAIDLPIESMIVNARYDNTTKEIVLTLQNGNTLRISVADLVSGLVSETQLQTILANYYNKTEVDDLLTNLAGRVLTNEEDIADIKTEQTTQNTNIEELQNQVETLQEDLESANAEIAELNTDITNMRKAMITVEGQGTDITLENTSENKFVEFGLEGRTEQEQLTGKNLFDGNFVKKYIDQSTGQPTSYEMTNYRATENYIELKANIEYIASRQDTAKGLILYYYEKNGDFITASAESQVNIKTTGLYDRDVLLKVVLMNCTNDKDYTLQVEQGSTATSYEPYCGGIPSPNPDYPQQIKNVTGNANVKIQNKNLLNIADGNTLTTKSFDITDFVEVGKTYSFSAYLDLKNTTSTAQARLRIDKYIGTEVSYLGGTLVANKSKGISKRENVTLESSVTKVVLTIQSYGVADFNCDYSQIMGEQGSTATSYVEHQEQNYPFTFAQSQRGMQGTQLLDDGIHQKRKQKIFDGTENWLAYGSTDNYIGVQVLLGDNIENNIGLCNYFINNKAIVYSRNGNAMWLDYNGGQGIIRMSISKEIAQSVQEFKQWLATKYANGTPVIVEYELAESELENNIIPYNATQQAQYDAIKQATSYDDITIISSESDELGFEMNVVAVADANKVIDKELQEIKSAVIALGGDINV